MKTNIEFRRLRALAVCLFAVTMLTGLVLDTDANAQRRAPVDKGEYLDQVIPELTSELKLTDQQAKDIRVILGEQFDQQQEMRQKMRGGDRSDREGMREKMQALRASTDQKVNALLTDEQQEAYKKYREKQDAERPNFRGGRPGQ